MDIYAHRGSSGTHPENTFAAFKEAARLPIFGVEFDVHMTRDGELVIIHDEKINRTSNGKGFVKDMTLNELKKYDFGAWFSKECKGEVIPTLFEVLELFSETSLQLNIELKSDVFPYPGMAEKVLDLVGAMKLDSRVVISSFNHEMIRTVKQLAPHIQTAALFMEVLVDPLQYIRAIPTDALHITKHAALRSSAKKVIEEGVPVQVFTVNKASQMKALKEIGVRAIFTDYPEKMSNHLNNTSIPKQSVPIISVFKNIIGKNK
ncbi:glycerophosphodiester phosphodiesterase [Sporosarcina sp. G11-34]|uniref:glycerophosphodiester phosphodiesterase n=1 Tax=Sporosarcina sp. G11-34 TaxID=2849605 RepID=UPI0022A92D3D|nr:glycerophosphodiester phosphodiesterase [Sporosarcina sp. G11-34]MCZ2260848.1 glycerophosphodiester phosphodiesterase [Sporosarcina sp. G11-34]